MTTNATPRVTALYRYAVKGLSPEKLDEATLSPGQTVPHDRAWAIENGPGRFDPAAPRHLPKINFLMLMRNERLATLETHFDTATETLTIRQGGQEVARGQLTTEAGRATIEHFLTGYMKADLRGAPKVVAAPGHSFSDVRQKCLHIVNLASVRELERVAGRAIDPLRFRPNVVIDGVEPWAEFSWVDKDISIGPARLDVFTRTQRCAATEVEPATGARNLSLPALLLRTFGHTDFGIYATVSDGGTVRPGDAITAS